MEMAGSRVTMPSTMILLDKDSGHIESKTDEMGDGLHKRTLSRNSLGSRVNDVNEDCIRRTPTPSKQVSLTSVRRKDNIDDDLQERSYTPPADSSKRLNGFYGDVHAVSTRLNQPMSSDSKPRLKLQDTATDSDKQSASSKEEDFNIKSPVEGEDEDVNVAKSPVEGEDEDDENKAPNQLLMEFVGCVMEEDYENAQKLCKMILLFEPDHPEAMKFQPLIEEKLKQEEEDSDGSDNDDSSSDDDDDDDDDSSDDSNQSTSDDGDEDNRKDQSTEGV